MKTLSNKSLALIASVIVLSAGFSSCTDEPEMVTPTVHADAAGVDSPADKPYGEKDAPCTIWWTGDEGVEAVTVNGANMPKAARKSTAFSTISPQSFRTWTSTAAEGSEDKINL